MSGRSAEPCWRQPRAGTEQGADAAAVPCTSECQPCTSTLGFTWHAKGGTQRHSLARQERAGGICAPSRNRARGTAWKLQAGIYELRSH